MWRAEDIFFAAMGGGNYGGPGIEQPERDRRRTSSATPGVSLALAPLMHGNAQWSMFVALFGGNTVDAQREPPLRRRRDLGPRRARERAASSRSSATRWRGPLVDALAHRAAPPSLFAIVSGGAILSPAIKQELNERAPNVAIVDAFGASETGANGAVDVTDKGPRFHMNEWTTVITEDGERRAGRRGRAARAARSRARRLLQGRGEDRGDVHRAARRALGDPRRPRGHRGRRHDHRARPRLAVHQHRRREGLPRRGRGGAEEPSRRVRRDRRRRPRRALGRGGRRGRRAARRSRGHARRARRPLPQRARRLQDAAPHRRRRRPSSARPRASRTTAGPRTSRPRAEAGTAVQ